MITSLQEYVKRGEISLEEAQESVKSRILGPKQADGPRPINTNIDVGDSGYIFVLDEKGIMVASPKIEGKNTWDATGPDGSLFTQEIIHKAMNGGGFTYYYWPSMEDANVLSEKVTYSEQDPHWGWIICAGTYTEDFIELLPLSLRLEVGDSYELRSIERIFSRLSPSFQRLIARLPCEYLNLR